MKSFSRMSDGKSGEPNGFRMGRRLYVSPEGAQEHHRARDLFARARLNAGGLVQLKCRQDGMPYDLAGQ